MRYILPHLPQEAELLELGLHCPWPVQEVHEDQPHDEVQLRVCVPQLPQAWDWEA